MRLDDEYLEYKMLASPKLHVRGGELAVFVYLKFLLLTFYLLTMRGKVPKTY